MIANTVWAVGIVAVTVGLLWLTSRALRLKHPVAKWRGVVVGALFSLLFCFITYGGIKGMFDLYMPRGTAVRDLKVDMSPARVERGKHIANMWCASCHSKSHEVPLSGGGNLSEEAHMPLGDLYPINLTPAGPLKDWTDGEIFR